MKKIISLLILFVATISVQRASANDSIIIGILEQPQCDQKPQLVVRAIFAKVGNGWLPLIDKKTAKSFNLSKVTWTATLHGQKIGTFETTDPGFHSIYEWTYPRDKFLEVADGQSVPKVSNNHKDFAGWCTSPSYRPIVVVSYPNFKDPAKWKPFYPGDKYGELLFSKFSEVVGEAQRCLYEPTYRAIPYKYRADELILSKSYKDRLGHKLVSLGLNVKTINCDGPIGPTESPNWFILRKGDTRHIGNELEVIDAADYDNDGRSEMLFWHNGYDEDGYSLFYDNFNKRVDFYWKYH